MRNPSGIHNEPANSWKRKRTRARKLVRVVGGEAFLCAPLDFVRQSGQKGKKGAACVSLWIGASGADFESQREGKEGSPRRWTEGEANGLRL